MHTPLGGKRSEPSLFDLAERFGTDCEGDDATGDTLPYRLLAPITPSAQPLPLVVFLHGAGERGRDNFAQLENGVASFLATNDRRVEYPCFYLVPQCPLGQRWVEVDWDANAHKTPEQPSRPTRLLLRLFDRLRADPRVDSRRVYLLGLSMGGFGVWDVMCRRPNDVAAGVSICGGCDEGQAAQIAHIPQWIFHGALDPVVSVERSRNMVAALQAAGGLPRYTEYATVGHNAWVSALAEPELLPWLWRQQCTR